MDGGADRDVKGTPLVSPRRRACSAAGPAGCTLRLEHRRAPGALVKVLVAGSSGFVGRRLCPALEAAGHTLQAMTRRPEAYRGAGAAVYGDVQDSESLALAMAGTEAAYYLVHSLADTDFAKRDLFQIFTRFILFAFRPGPVIFRWPKIPTFRVYH